MSEPSSTGRVQDLDQALLFLSAFAASILIVGFNLAFKPDLVQFAILVPPLVMVGLMPLYAGYMRGSIELQSLRERARGWVYLIFGLGWYSFTAAIAPIALGSDLSLKTLGLYVETFVVLVLLAFTKRFVLWFYKINGIANIPMSDKIGIFSLVSGLFVSAITYQAILGFTLGETLNSQPFVYTPAVAQAVSLGTGIAFLIPLVLIEVKSHHCLDEAAVLFEKVRPKFSLKPKAPKWGANVLDLPLLAIMPLLLVIMTRGSVKFLLELTGSVALLVIGITSASYLGWTGTTILFLGDLALFLTAWSHSRLVWKGAGTPIVV